MAAFAGKALLVSVALGLASPSGAAELVMSTGQLAPLYESATGEARPDHRVYLYPGLALQPWPASGATSSAPAPYVTATGLLVLASPARVLAQSQVEAIRKSLGDRPGFLVESFVAEARVDGEDRMIALGQSEAYRIVARRPDNTVLAVDLCDLLWEELRSCWDADTPRIMHPVRVPNQAVAIVDLRQASAGEFAPPAEIFKAGDLEGLQRECGEDGWRAFGAGGDSRDATPLLRALEAEGFVLPDRYSGEVAARITFFAGRERHLRQLEQLRDCSGEVSLRFVLDDGQGRRAIVDAELAMALGLGVEAASGRPVVGCAAEFWRLFDAVRAQGLAEADAHLLLAYSLAWSDPHWLRCSTPTRAHDPSRSAALAR